MLVCACGVALRASRDLSLSLPPFIDRPAIDITLRIRPFLVVSDQTIGYILVHVVT